MKSDIMYKPTINGRASICHWTLSVSFKTKEQTVKALKKILKEDIDFPVSYRTEMTSDGYQYFLDIDDMSWAANLSTVAKILEKVDYTTED